MNSVTSYDSSNVVSVIILSVIIFCNIGDDLLIRDGRARVPPEGAEVCNNIEVS